MTQSRQHTLALTVLTALIWVASGPAFAHHAMGGVAPTNFYLGFVSGLAHPVINFSHFAFIIGVGIMTAVAQGSKLLPLFFVGGTIAGCLLSVHFALPMSEVALLATVIVIGLALALGRQRLGIADLGLFAVGGVLHGLAYAQAIMGSEQTAINGYLLGFAVVQSALALGAMFAAYALWCGDKLYANARIAGGVVAGVGLTLLAQAGLSLLPLVPIQ